MRRRTFIAGLGSAAAWPAVVRAQGERVRRIGVLLNAGAADPESQTRLGAFLQALALLGWTIGRNVGVDIHWGTTDAAEIHKHATELAALAPDVILANGAVTVGPLLQVTRADSVCCRCRSGRCRLGRQLGTAGGQCYRFRDVRIQHKWEMG